MAYTQISRYFARYVGRFWVVIYYLYHNRYIIFERMTEGEPIRYDMLLMSLLFTLR